MKYNEYYSSSMLGRIGITLRGEEKELEPDEDEQVILYVDRYLLMLDDFIDITNKYRTHNRSGWYEQIISAPFGGTPYFSTIGHYGFNEQRYWDTSEAYGIAKYNDGTGGIYYIGESNAPVAGDNRPMSAIPSLIAENPEVTDTMKVLQAFNDKAIATDMVNSFHNLSSRGGKVMFGLKEQEMYGIQNSITKEWLLPRFDGFTVPSNIPIEIAGWMHSFANPKTKWTTSSIRAKCINGVVTFDSPQPWVNTATNFPFDLSSFTIDNSMQSTMYMWFQIICTRQGFVCTKKEAEKWIDDTNKWINSVGLDKGMMQIHLDPHIMDIPDWYAESLGI